MNWCITKIYVFSLFLAGWRVSAEQQISDIELQKLKSPGDIKQAKLLPYNQVLENIKEAAYSIYEQYLSEKVLIRKTCKMCC